MDRDNFILENMGLVRMAVNRFSHRILNHPSINKEDLMSIGTIGLIKAYDRFDTSYGTKFSTYAVPMIIGELKLFLRDNFDTIHFTRQSKHDYYTIVRANLLNEKPSVIGSILEMPLENVHNALDYYKYKYADSLDRVIYEDEGSPIVLKDTVGIEMDLESNLDLELFLKKIDDQAQRVIKLRLQGLSQAEIAKIIGCSQVQVSRILAKVKKKIQEGGIKLNKKPNTKYELAKKLAKETELNAYEIQAKTGISIPTAYNYIKQYRPTKGEIEEAEKKMEGKESPVKSYKLSPEELEGYRLDKPIIATADHKVAKSTEPIEENLGETSNAISADGDITMTFKLSTEDAKLQLENIVQAITLLGFKEFNITIQSYRVA